MLLSRQTVVAMALASALALCATFTTAQAVDISAEQLNGILESCVVASSPACIAALEALLTAFPGVAPSVVIGTVAAQLAALSNNALTTGVPANFAAIQSSLSTLASYAASTFGLTSLGTTIAAIATAVGDREVVDIAAVASGDGDGDGAPDVAASPV